MIHRNTEGINCSHPTDTSVQFQALTELINNHANQAKGNTQELLKLLRYLEQMHRQVRDTFFQDALPTNRQALYTLLREIESEGGWPYIPRMQLTAYLKHVVQAEETQTSGSSESH